MRLNRVLRYRPRYADVAATLALLLATSGTAYAAGAFPAHSVGAKQLKRSAVTKSKVATGAIISSKLRSSSVTATKLATNSVTATKLALSSVTATKLAPSSVTGAAIADGSVTLADIAGTDVTGDISFSIGTGNCMPLTLTVAGAAVGQVAYLSWVGSTAPPASIVDGPMKVTAPDTVVARFCNVGAATATATSLGVRVITLG
jgi:hypothetical protein